MMRIVKTIQSLLCACLLISPFLDPRANGQETGSLVHELQPFVDRHELAGAVMAVATVDRTLAIETVGFADIAQKKPMQKDSLFWIASQSKPITAAAVMVLVDQGKLTLDDPVEKYLPEFKGIKFIVDKEAKPQELKTAEPITIRQVLSHMSGLPFKSQLEQPTLDLFPLSVRCKSYAAAPLDFEPGTKYQYSNAGINTAARIIEVVSQQSFESFLDKHILEPLGMNETSFWPSSAQVERVAKAYKPGKNNEGLEEISIDQLHYPLTDRTVRTPMPAGGLFSTAGDIIRFYQMLFGRGEFNGKRILSENAVAELTRRQTPNAVPTSYGLGFQVSPDTFGHGGAYSTNTVANKKTGRITVWLVQHAGFPGEGKRAQEVFQQAAK